MTDHFEAQVSAWVRKTKQRTTAVFRESSQRVIDEAQTPVFKGGRMRVDTGFLRNSGQASLNGLPSGPSRQREGVPGPWETDTKLTIARAQLGQTIYFGWTAAYALAREYHDGFARGAAQKWRRIVSAVARELRSRNR